MLMLMLYLTPTVCFTVIPTMLQFQAMQSQTPGSHRTIVTLTNCCALVPDKRLCFKKDRIDRFFSIRKQYILGIRLNSK